MMAERIKMSGWGRRPFVRAPLYEPRNESDIQHLLQENAPIIARGCGRSYGDSSFSENGALASRRLNRFVELSDDGILCCESGVVLDDVIRAMVPRGWFPAVVPGTKNVTIGGMIASNVHGKNGVKDGAFADHVTYLDLLRADGNIVRCTPQQNEALFFDTVGGMGLTGMVIRAAFQLKPIESAWIKQTRTAHNSLQGLMDAFEESDDATYRVAWVDVLSRGSQLGRSILDIGEHARLDELPSANRADPFALKRRLKLNVPISPPISPLNRLTVKAYNAVHYGIGRSNQGERVVDLNSYFFPLDAILNWNRAYGRAGFAQYQCVLPKHSSKSGLTELLTKISKSGHGSFLAVIKRLGPTIGAMSFPMDGYTLALDFPWSNGVASLLDQLDEITHAHGGRLYLAKDSRLSRNMLRKMQPEVCAFRSQREDDGSADRFASSQSQRLGM